jgi:hypothetical protein
LGHYCVQSHGEKTPKVGNCINKDVECDNKDNTIKGCVHSNIEMLMEEWILEVEPKHV